MYSELDEVAESIFNNMPQDAILHMQTNTGRIRVFVLEQMGEESATVIDGVTESLTDLILNAKAA